jgi:hypothetical protein
MNRILTGIVGHDSPDLVSDHEKLRTYIQTVYSCRAAERKFDEAVDSADLDHPTVEMTRKLRRLENRFATLLERQIAAEPEITTILKANGCRVNCGGVLIDGFLCTLTRSNAYDKSSVSIVTLDSIRLVSPGR